MPCGVISLAKFLSPFVLDFHPNGMHGTQQKNPGDLSFYVPTYLFDPQHNHNNKNYKLK